MGGSRKLPVVAIRYWVYPNLTRAEYILNTRVEHPNWLFEFLPIYFQARRIFGEWMSIYYDCAPIFCSHTCINRFSGSMISYQF